MATYTLQNIRDLARGKDQRLETKSDAWIDDKIDSAFEVAESGKQVFTFEEHIDLSQEILDGVDSVEIVLTKEPHFVYDVILGGSHFSYRVSNDNKILIDIDLVNAATATDKTILVKYSYYPTSNFVSMEMNKEVYHYFRHCLYVNLYGSLRDKENEMYHQEQVDRFVASGSMGLQNDFDQYVPMKGGFDTTSQSNNSSSNPLW